jgi:single-strand DNA-binding protein
VTLSRGGFQLEEFLMSMINVSIVGNLARTPEQICFASGKVKTIMVVAVNNSQAPKNGEKSSDVADYYRVETWGRLAELAQKYLNKGNQVGVSGRLIMEHWTDKQGNDRLTPVVCATQLSFPPRSGSNKDDNNLCSLSRGGDDESDDDLFAGARAITVAEPPADYYQCYSRLPARACSGR